MPANLKEIPFMPSTLETIDFAIYHWLRDDLNLHTNTQEGFEKVPVIWTSAERAFQVKRSNDLRDQDGTLILPAPPWNVPPVILTESNVISEDA